MKKLILVVALATLAQADMCKNYINLIGTSLKKVEYFNNKDNQRMCHEVLYLREYIVSAKVNCDLKPKLFDDLLEEVEVTYKKNCKGKKVN